MCCSAWVKKVSSSEGGNRRKLLLPSDLLGNHVSVALIHFVGPRVVLGTNHPVEATVYKLDGAIVFNRDSYTANSPNHFPEVFSSGNPPSQAVVVRTVDSGYEPQALHIDVLPFSGVVKRHRIGVPGIKPTDRTRADARQHGSLLIGGFQQLIDAQAAPDAHPEQGVSAANVNDIGRKDLFSDLFSRRSFFGEEKHFGFALQEVSEVFPHVLPVSSGVRTRGGDKEKLRMSLVREPDNLPVNEGGSSCSDFTAADRNDSLGHRFILASNSKLPNLRFGLAVKLPRVDGEPWPSLHCLFPMNELPKDTRG